MPFKDKIKRIKEELYSERHTIKAFYRECENSYDYGHSDGKLELIDKLLKIIDGEN